MNKDTDNQQDKPTAKNQSIKYVFLILLMMLSNLFTIYLYDKFVMPKFYALDIQKLIINDQDLKRFLNKEITENDYQIALSKNTEVFNNALAEDMKNNPNGIYIVKSAFVTAKDTQNRKIEDATNRILETMASSIKK